MFDSTETENTPVDEGDWEIAFKPYATYPDDALSLARHFMAIRGFLQSKPPDIPLALEALEDAVEALYPPKTINGEVSVLRQLLKHAALWYRFADYRAIRNHKPAIGRAVTSEEQARLFEVAQSRADWLNAFTAGVLGAFCGMRGCEIKALQWKGVDLATGVLDIRHSKTPAGWRSPTLNSICKESLAALRAKAIVADHASPEHYLFPATVKGKLDPSQHAKGWRSAWLLMRRKAATGDGGEVIYPNLLTIRFHDTLRSRSWQRQGYRIKPSWPKSDISHLR